jgi:hypothetical protein
VTQEIPDGLDAQARQRAGARRADSLEELDLAIG